CRRLIPDGCGRCRACAPRRASVRAAAGDRRSGWLHHLLGLFARRADAVGTRSGAARRRLCDRLGPCGPGCDHGRNGGSTGGTGMSMRILTLSADVGESRLDRWLNRRFPEISQGAIENLCRPGQLRVDGARFKASSRVAPGEQVRVPPLPKPEAATAPKPSCAADMPEADARMIQAAVLWKDEHIIA